MAVRRQGFVRGRGHSRKTEWAATAPETGYVSLAAATKLLDSTFIVTSTSTIVRVRGLLSVKTDQEAANESPFGALGICVVSEEAAAIGPTAIPGPYTNADSDLWMLHEFWSCPISLATAVGIAQLDRQYQLDSKAMRKMTPEESLAVMIENGAGTAGAAYRLDLRVLAKLA